MYLEWKKPIPQISSFYKNIKATYMKINFRWTKDLKWKKWILEGNKQYTKKKKKKQKKFLKD